MLQQGQCKRSRSLAVYGLLLELYPRTFLQRHRAEMIQNFADLEDAVASKAKLWLLIGTDLANSLREQLFRSRLGRYVVAVFVTWVSLFVVGYFSYGPTPGHPALHVFGGFLPGMLAMHIAARRYRTPQNRIARFFRSRFDICAIGIFAVCVLLFLTAYFFYGPGPGHPALQVFGGCLIGMLAMYIATHVYGTR